MKQNQILKAISNLSENEAKDQLESFMTDTYTLVQWPESQNLMDRWCKDGVN